MFRPISIIFRGLLKNNKAYVKTWLDYYAMNQLSTAINKFYNICTHFMDKV